MKTVTIEELKQSLPQILENLDEDGLLVRDGERDCARITPASGPHADLIGIFKGKIHIKGDIFSTGIKWDAES